MSHKTLDGRHRQARLGQVAAKGMAKLVAGDPQPGFPAVFRQAILDPGHGQALAKLVEKDGLVISRWTDFQPGFERGQTVEQRGRPPAVCRLCHAATGAAGCPERVPGTGLSSKDCGLR